MPRRHRTPPPSDHWNGRRFHNPRHHINRTWLDVLRWKRTARPAVWPTAVEITPATDLAPPARGFAVTWVNHATFLIRTRTHTVLTDPQWSDCAGPFGRFGPRRIHPPGIAFDDLPPIDAVLLSHDHYDHCDLPTLRRLARRSPHTRLVAPLGHEDLAHRAGFADKRVDVLDWWETVSPANGSTITATPARHWSNRLSGRRNARLWCGYHLRHDKASVYFSGDTAADDEMFADIRARLGAPDLALLPIGAYEPRWFMASQHCNPAEAVAIHQAVGAVRSIGTHWGTFQLTDEAREAPLHELAAAIEAAGLPPESFTAPPPGTTVTVDGIR